MFKGISVTVRITIVAMALILLLGVVIIVFSHYVYRGSATRYNAAQVTSIANAIAGIIDPVLFAESMAGDEPDEKWEAVYNYLNIMFGRIEGLAYLYILTPTTDGMFHYYASSAIPGGFLVLEEDEELYAHEATDSMRLGQTLSTGIFDAGDWGILVTAYAPIIDHNGRVLGLVGVDLYAEHVFVGINRFTLNISVFVLVGVLVSGIILSQILRQTVTKPLNELMKVASNVKNGELNFNRNRGNIASGELGQLTVNMYDLADSVGNIIQDFDTMTKEHLAGHYNFVLDKSKYSGAYSRLVEQMNAMTSHYVQDTIRLINVMKEYSQGNFDYAVH
ncbi:MAG: hypothetical protein FWC89_06585, partial [Defluviitaleaceae bacterium]|nr:hypothetical protein [Defluviitaleaceae bacterium]